AGRGNALQSILRLREHEPLIAEASDRSAAHGEPLLGDAVALPVVHDQGFVVNGGSAYVRQSEPTQSAILVAFPAQALAGDVGDLLLVLPDRIREVEPAAGREERHHAAIGGACWVGVGALILREALHVASAHVGAEDVPGSTIAPHEHDLLPLGIVAEYRRHVVRAAEAHALTIEEDLRVAALIRDVRELTAGSERRVCVETAVGDLAEPGAVGAARPDVALPVLRDDERHLVAAEGHAEDEAR